MLSLEQAQQWNVPAFIYYNHIVNENAVPISFKRHKFLIDPYLDNSKELVVKKCSQIGFSTLAIIRAFHLAKYKGANVIYTLPSKSIVKDFVNPKVNPLIESNPVIKGMVGHADSIGLKSIGDRFVYFRSSWDEASGIAISAHILINDELDRSNQKAVSTYKTRLDAALLDRPDLGWHWKFSNPSIDGYGVDEAYQRSDQKMWYIKCPHCNKHQTMQFPENIDFKTKMYICSFCHRTLSDEDRTRGEWVRRYLGRDVSGYWITQLMAPWIPASKLISDSIGDQSIFYNFTLGLAYTSKDIQVSRTAIQECIYPTSNPMTNVAMGVDNGIMKHYVIGNKYGIFRIGHTEDWQEIENLRNQYDAYMVCDANPYPTPVMTLVRKYQGKVFAHYYRDDKKEEQIIRWGDGDNAGIVESDRTKIIDAVVADINSKDLLFNMSLTVLENEEYIKHWLNMYRIIVESDKGIRAPKWMTVGQDSGGKKADHMAHATVLFKVAMQQTLSQGTVIQTPMIKPKQQIDKAMYIRPDNTVSDGFSLDKLKDQFDKPKGKSWVTR